MENNTKPNLTDAIVKIKKLIELLKTRQLPQKEFEDVVSFVVQIIDEFFFKTNSITYRLNKNIIKNNRDLNLDIKLQGELFPTKDTHEFLYLTKTLLSIFITKKLIFRYFIFSEINMILSYYIASTIANKSFDSLNYRFKINEAEYHNQVVMYKYLFSIFDKMTYISAFIVDKHKLNQVDLSKNLIFTKDFEVVAHPLFKSLVKKENTKSFLKILDSSSSFHFVRKLRNNLEHSFTDPSLEYNIALETEMLFILIMRTVIQINGDFRTDEGILKLINLNH